MSACQKSSLSDVQVIAKLRNNIAGHAIVKAAIRALTNFASVDASPAVVRVNQCGRHTATAMREREQRRS